LDTAGPAFSPPALKSLGHVAPPRRIAETRLRRSGSHAFQGVQDRNPATPGDLPREQFRLVEASVPEPAPMQRNRRHGVEPVIARHGGCQQISQGALQRPDPAVLVEMNQLPKGAFVSPKTVSRIKTAEPIATEGATALFIQRKAVLKWSAATAAEEFRVQRLWSV
jgi:hypothetical protein